MDPVWLGREIFGSPAPRKYASNPFPTRPWMQDTAAAASAGTTNVGVKGIIAGTSQSFSYLLIVPCLLCQKFQPLFRSVFRIFNESCRSKFPLFTSYDRSEKNGRSGSETNQYYFTKIVISQTLVSGNFTSIWNINRVIFAHHNFVQEK